MWRGGGGVVYDSFSLLHRMNIKAAGFASTFKDQVINM